MMSARVRSGLLGAGARGTAAGRPGAGEHGGRFAGIARPSNVIDVKSESSQGAHSAPFPRALVEFFVKAFSDEGDLVFDPFLGSGTTIIAAERTGRVCYGMELDPGYVDTIVRRWQRFTGKSAVHQKTGRSFDEIEKERCK